MPASNTVNTYGLVARCFHWLTALLILSAIPLGIIANDMAATPDTILAKTQLFSLHKTVGVAAFLLGLLRILWALGQPRPAPLHPERRLESFVAALVHWLLYLSLLIVPLSGWVHHAAVEGFAPILWPFGQDLPFVPKSEGLALLASGLHWVFTKLLIAAVLLHFLGVLKHVLIDRDATLARMTRGTAAPEAPRPAAPHLAPFALALTFFAAGTLLALWLTPASPALPAASQQAEATEGNWQVTEGSLTFTVQQMGAAVDGHFSRWQADIRHDDSLDEGQTGAVKVEIDLTSISLGSVTDQAKGPEFLDVDHHPAALFTANLIAGPQGQTADGTLTLRGVEKPLVLPFDLTITGDTAKMTGEVTLDRRDFGIGASYEDEGTVGFAVGVKITLTAQRL